MEAIEQAVVTSTSFFDRPGVRVEQILVGPGIPLGIEQVSNQAVGIAGAYGAWGESYDNPALPSMVETRLGRPLAKEEILTPADLGFVSRHHVYGLTAEQDIAVELEAGARMLRAAALANGWQPAEVQAVLIGASGPVTADYVEQIAQMAGIPADAWKITLHKACDGSVGGLQLALNRSSPENARLGFNLTDRLDGKKILVGGIEGLSRFMNKAPDTNAQQLFGTAAGVIGVIPGKTMKFLVGRTREVYDEEGLLQVKMLYPFAGHQQPGESLIEVTHTAERSIRVAGKQHEPADGTPVIMAGLMGMVKLFVRTGVEVVRDTYADYRALMQAQGTPEKSIAAAVVHHANLKINKLKEKHLTKEGINLNMPWVLSDFGNVSAASPMIAFLRQLPQMKPGDHILIDGFGAGTYYDVLVVELSSQA